MPTLLRRVIGAMRLDAAVFEEVEADPGASRHAALVVGGFSFAAGLGLAGHAPSLASFAATVAGCLIGWVSWAALVHRLGTGVFREPQTRADLGQLLRTIGFSASPGLLLLLLLLPLPKPAVFVPIALWMLAAMVVGVRQALDCTGTGHALKVTAAAAALVAALVVLGGYAFGPVVS